MKSFLLTLSFAIIGTLTQAQAVNVTTKVTEATVYHSGALVQRSGNVNLKAGVNELQFRNLSSKIILSSLKVNNKEMTVLNKSVVKKLTTEEMKQLEDQKEALTNQLALIEKKFNEATFVKEVEDLEKMIAFYSTKMLEIKRSIRSVEKQITDAQKLKDIKLDNENAAILKLVVSVEKPLNTQIKLQYVCGSIGWSPAYEISVNSSSDRTIEIKYLAKLMSQTGENWDNITVKLSSSFPLEPPTSLPKPESPWVLEGSGYNYGKRNMQNAEGFINPQQEIDKLEGVTYTQISIPSILKVRTLQGKFNIKSNSTVFTFPIMKMKLPARYYYYGYPSIDPDVYLVGEVTKWDTIGLIDGVANITFAGNDVGKSIIKFSESEDTLMLPVGKDNSVYMVRREMADQKYFKERTVNKKRVSTMAYEFVLKNNNSFPIDFVLADQIPISQTKSAEVEIEKTSGGKLDAEQGEVAWTQAIKPGQSISKELIYTIETSSDYHYSRGRNMQKFRTISCPSF